MVPSQLHVSLELRTGDRSVRIFVHPAPLALPENTGLRRTGRLN